MSEPVLSHYLFDEPAFDYHDAAYVPLVVPAVPAQALKIPPLLQPDKVEGDDVYYTIDAQEGSVQFFPGQATKTWGYNAPLLGQTVHFERGKTYHMHLKNDLPEVTTYHWHGLDIPGPIEDGGCHAPVYPGEARDITFKVDQPGCLAWLHAHPCPATAEQVWHGLACGALITDPAEEKLPLPHTYGVDDLPLILQDRHFHADNQWDYRADYDPDGVAGPTPMINGTLNPYFDVTTPQLRLRLLDGANRREWRLHFDHDLAFDQVAGDLSLLPHPVKMTKLMLTCAERAEIVVDFSQFKPGEVVTLYSDQTPLVKFRIKELRGSAQPIPHQLFTRPALFASAGLPVHQVTLDGMDEMVAMNGRKFKMDRIDYTLDLGDVQVWDILNTSKKPGMLHPYHMHGSGFYVLSRNGQVPYPNETGIKDTVAINPEEHVRILVHYNHPGVFMYHCHIMEHEDGGMMAQIKIIDPNDPNKHYPLMDHMTLMMAFAKERGVSMDELWIGGMESYKQMGMEM